MSRLISFGGAVYRSSGFDGPCITLNPIGDISVAGTLTELIRATLAMIKLSIPLELSIRLGGETNGFSVSRRTIVVGDKWLTEEAGGERGTGNPTGFRNNLLQLLGLAIWRCQLTGKARRQYAAVIADLPSQVGPGRNLSPRDDFAVAAAKFWASKLKRPRSSFMEAYVYRRKDPWMPRDKATQLSGPIQEKWPLRGPGGNLEPDPAPPGAQKRPPNTLLSPGTLNQQERLISPANRFRQR